MSNTLEPGCCPSKLALEERILLSDVQALNLEGTFKTLGNATRLRLLHALVRSGELCVGELGDKLGMKQPAVSNQLRQLSDRGIVEARREGLQMFYRIVDPCVVSLLNLGWCLTEDAAKRIEQEQTMEVSVR
jgi:ArsR family transcriptional regulator, lead/cadmium/zinc/bismuth-responsive transcriptional repressor